ncbi:MAG: hypothetical protein ABR555_08075 [Pyrinomonadaceae bacterium]
MRLVQTEIRCYVTWRQLFIQLVVLAFSITALGQTQPATPTKTPTEPATSTSTKPAAVTAAPKRIARPEDDILNKMRASRNNPPETVDLIVRLVKEFPDSMGAESAGYSFASAIKRQAALDSDVAKRRSLAARFIEAMASAPSPLQVWTNSSAINAMLDNDLAPEAVTLAQQTISLLDQKAFLAARRKSYERDVEFARKSNPSYKPRPFVEADFVEMFRGSRASYYARLGRGLLKLNKMEEAEQAYKQSFAVEPNAQAAVGLATILEQRGKDKEALDYLARGVLTGKLDKKGIAQFHDLYRKTHGGELNGAEKFIDALYREGYRNPIKTEKYERVSGQTDRVVLAEFFTGAGCVPCIPFDYSFEADLDHYSRKELTVLVYHWHAPTMDPLGNRSSDARVSYYDVHGAPTTLVDGVKFNSADDDSRSKSEAVNVAQRVYGEINSTINAELRTAPKGEIKLDAKRVGDTVEVNLTARPFEGVSADVSLQLALIENEVHYSGENGLRFHLMVVRNLARQAGSENYGFNIDPNRANKIDYVFDIKDIIAQNLRYYTDYPAERRKEFAARVGAEAAQDIGIDFSFKEERNIIDPNNLSVVAFLQNNKTKEVLQSAYLRVASGTKRKDDPKGN